MAVYVEGWVSTERRIFRSASSCCAVTVILDDGGTRGVHPRCNCAARWPESTANSKALIPLGRLINRHPHKQQGFDEGSTVLAEVSEKQDA